MVFLLVLVPSLIAALDALRIAAISGPATMMLAKLLQECGELVTEVTQGKADGRVCDNELRRCIQQWTEMVAAGQALMQGLQEANVRTHGQWEAR